MNLRERWARRGPAWRFPSWEEGVDNLRNAWGRLGRLWVWLVVAAIWAVALIPPRNPKDRTAVLAGALILTLVLLRIVGSFGPRRRR
ncbi:MAG: hypothetical protein ABMA25_05880 [Ilumatobacteraceae bacterium]